MTFKTGLSGLNAAAKNLEVIGNNIANGNTVGFKQSTAQFSNLLAAQINGAGASEIGMGVQLSRVAQNFTGGNLTKSGNSMDLAIMGDGFFRMSNDGAITYSRNGQFELDRSGFITDMNHARLTGYAVDETGQVLSGLPKEIQIPTAAMTPQQTTKVDLTVNLKEASPIPAGPFSATDPRTYNYSSPVTVFDSLGTAHLVQAYYVKTATVGEWDVYASCDGDPLAPQIGTLAFTSNGTIDTATTTLPFAASFSLSAASVATSPLTIDFDFTGSTQNGNESSNRSAMADGFAPGELVSFKIGEDGIITGHYTNGKASPVGQVALAKFRNANGLQPIGNNGWVESAASGQPIVGAPGSGGLGSLQSSTIEESNVDMTGELVNLITAQRMYQANAQSIKANDEMLQTMINLVR